MHAHEIERRIEERLESLAKAIPSKEIIHEIEAEAEDYRKQANEWLEREDGDHKENMAAYDRLMAESRRLERLVDLIDDIISLCEEKEWREARDER